MAGKNPLIQIDNLEMFSRKLQRLKSHANKVKDISPEALAICEMGDLSIERSISLYKNWYKSMADAARNAYVKHTNRTYDGHVILAHDKHSPGKPVIGPQYVIVSTVQDINESTKWIYIIPGNRHRYETSETGLHTFNIRTPETNTAYVNTPWVDSISEYHKDELEKYKDLVDFRNAYQVVSESIKFRAYLKDQLVNNVL